MYYEMHFTCIVDFSRTMFVYVTENTEIGLPLTGRFIVNFSVLGFRNQSWMGTWNLIYSAVICSISIYLSLFVFSCWWAVRWFESALNTCSLLSSLSDPFCYVAGGGRFNYTCLCTYVSLYVANWVDECSQPTEISRSLLKRYYNFTLFVFNDSQIRSVYDDILVH